MPATVASMSSTANMMLRRPSVFPGAFSGSALTAVGVWNFVSSSRPWPSGVRIIAPSTRTPSSPTTRSTQRPSIRRLALQLHTKFDKERNSSLKVVDDDAHVVHPLNRHGGSPSSSRGLSWPLLYLGRNRRRILDSRKWDLLLAVTALGRPH